MELHYESYGAGPALVVLHGLFGSAENSRTLNKHVFAKSFSVYAPDQRNHGHSPHSDVFNFEVMTEDLIKFFGDHALESTFLLGHSMGGKVAIHTALTHPDCVDRLIIVDIAPRAYPPRHQTIFDALRGINLADARSRKDLDQALAPKVPEKMVRQFLLKNVERSGNNSFRWRINLEAIAANYESSTEPALGDLVFAKPTLFIRGGRSPYVTAEDEPIIKKHFPQARIITIDDAGHWVHYESPKVFAQKVQEFLGDGEWPDAEG